MYLSPNTTALHTETRPWGFFEVLLDSDACKVKRITVHPGKRLSLQSHEQRAEHWICINSGDGAVAWIGGRPVPLEKDVTVHIGRSVPHRLDNTEGTWDAVIIEVQTGTYFGEDDIVRYEDDFGRQ